MKISLDWIREFVTVDLPRQELLDRLTMIGLVADTVEERDGDAVLDLETYANRPDTLGHLGVAREIGAMLTEAGFVPVSIESHLLKCGISGGMLLEVVARKPATAAHGQGPEPRENNQ